MDDLEQHRMKLRSKLAKEIDQRAFDDIAALLERYAALENKSGTLWINAIFDRLLSALVEIAAQMPDASKRYMIQSLRDATIDLQSPKQALIDAADDVSFDVILMEADDLKAAGEYLRECKIDARANPAQVEILRAIGKFYLAAAAHNSFRPTRINA